MMMHWVKLGAVGATALVVNKFASEADFVMKSTNTTVKNWGGPTLGIVAAAVVGRFLIKI